MILKQNISSKIKELRRSCLIELLSIINKNFLWTKFKSDDSSFTGPSKVISEEKTDSIGKSLLKSGLLNKQIFTQT